MLLVTLLLMTGPPPSQESSNRTASLISHDDYPQIALQNDWEGEVIVDLTISTAGHPRACWIVQSSGYPILDHKTCEIMLLRARFVPAKDQRGNLIEDRFRTPKIHWRIEK